MTNIYIMPLKQKQNRRLHLKVEYLDVSKNIEIEIKIHDTNHL